MEEFELDQQDGLKEVVARDKNLFEEVLQSYVELFRVAVKLLDADGNRLVGATARSDLCRYVYSIDTCQETCRDLVASIRQERPEFQTISQTACFSGAEYRVVPIHRELDVVGKLVFGPFLPADVTAPPEAFLAMDPQVDRETAWQKTLRFRRLRRGLAERAAQTVATVIEVMVFLACKSEMTTSMHVEAISEVYRELGQLREELAARRAEVLGLRQQRANFMSAVSRETRTPLMSLVSHAEMLREGVAGDLAREQSELLDTIVEQGENLSAMASQIDELARVERGRMQIRPVRIACQELLGRAYDEARQLAARGEIDIELDTSPSWLPDVEADPQIATTVFHLLLDNAVKFTRAGGRIRLAARAGSAPDEGADPSDAAVRFTISDTGIGIEAKHLDHLFEPFYRVLDTLREVSGWGLGLPLARAYAEAQGGGIELASSPDRGTVATFWLPVFAGDAESSP
jgi:signal transduction histidine kinase